MAIARDAADDNLVAELLWARAWVLLYQGQNESARPMIESGLGLARRLGEPHLTGRLLGARAHATYEAADHAARPVMRPRPCGCAARPVTGSWWANC